MFESKYINFMDLAINVISVTGGFVFVASLGIQLIKIIRTGTSEDLSFGWLILMTLAIAAGLVYGIYNNLWPIYSANGAQFLLSLGLMIVKIIHCKRVPYTFSA